MPGAAWIGTPSGASCAAQVSRWLSSNCDKARRQEFYRGFIPVLFVYAAMIPGLMARTPRSALAGGRYG